LTLSPFYFAPNPFLCPTSLTHLHNNWYCSSNLKGALEHSTEKEKTSTEKEYRNLTKFKILTQTQKRGTVCVYKDDVCVCVKRIWLFGTLQLLYPTEGLKQLLS